MGRGRQRWPKLSDKRGFPRKGPKVFSKRQTLQYFTTGDLGKATVTKGLNQGTIRWGE
jgi:hypothetical protein